MSSEAKPGALRFSDFELDPRSGELFRGGAKVRLTEKPFQLLVALLERPGEVVLREELRNRLWSADTFVDFDNNLNAAARKLREALGDSADAPRFIETLPRRGYRFIGSLESRTRPLPAERRGLPKTLAFAAIAVAGAVLGWLVLPRDVPVASPPEGRMLLAVMPFENLDPDRERDYFSDGLTEEMIAQLGRLEPARLGVIARLSSMQYKGSDKSIEEIGRELDVDYVLEGSVRSAGDEIRVTAQLIQVTDQTHLWSETYDRRFAELLEIQADVAQRVAGSLALELLPDEPAALARAATNVTEAYQEYLRGRHHWARWTGDGYRRAIVHFERAIELDPDYAQAHAGLADAYNLLAFDGLAPTEAFPAARAAANRALELNPDLAEAHNSLGFVRLYSDYDPVGADASFRRAIEIRPNYAMAYHWWSGALSAMERHDEAIEAVEQSLELDPVSLSVMSDLGWYYLFADRPAEALDVCERTLELQPSYGWAESCRAEALIHLGRLEEVLASFPRDATDGADPRRALDEAFRMRLERRIEAGEIENAEPVWLAMEFAAAGEIDEAFRLLERGLEARDPWLIFLRVDPRFDHLADDPRYDDLSRRIGLAPFAG